jgi:DNA sulfur modification protein DndE
MRDRITLSKQGTALLETVKPRLLMGGQDDYIPLRIAFGRSLQIKQASPVFDLKGEDLKTTRSPKSLPLSTFEQEHGLVFQTLLSQLYQTKIEDDNYIDKLVLHIEHGLWMIYNETEKIKGYDYISTLVGSLMGSTSSKGTTSESRTSILDTSVLKLHIGQDKKGNSVDCNINTANNPHVAIMGGSGSGKTYFLKHFLKEIREQSDYETHFIIFDYKDGDIATDKAFQAATRADLIDMKTQPLPLNIFKGANTETEHRERAMQVVNIVKNVEANIGKVQENNLYQAILNSYENDTLPDFGTVRDELQKINSKADSLTSVLRPLVDLNYFAKNTESVHDTWTNRTLIVDIHQIESKELVVFFILNQLHQELKRLGVSPQNPNTKAKKIRTFIVIDEAHYFLANKKRAKILENMIRDVRSAGGAVVLASQSPDDYDKSDFNFLELIEFAFVLKSTPDSHTFLEKKFSLKTVEAKQLLLQVGGIARGEAYMKVGNGVVLVELCK